MEKTVFILLGPSGQGKRSAAKYLEDLGVKKVVTHTTRSMRDGEIDGVDYYFITRPMMNKVPGFLRTNYMGNHVKLSEEEYQQTLLTQQRSYITLEAQGVIELRERLEIEKPDHKVKVLYFVNNEPEDETRAYDIVHRRERGKYRHEYNNHDLADEIFENVSFDEIKERLFTLVTESIEE